MKQTPRPHRIYLLFFAWTLLSLLLPSPAHAKGKHHGKNGGEDKPADTSEWVPPADWPAGARVSSFLQTYLEQNILAPLDAPALPPRVALGSLDLDFASHLAAAQTPTERTLYANATNLCDLLARILDARESQQISLLSTRAGGLASNPLDAPTAAVSGHYSWNLEAERARSQHHQEVQAQLNALDRKNFFVANNLRQWTNQTPGYRQAVQNAAVNVNAAQIRYDRERTAPNVPPPATPATGGTPGPAPVSAPIGKP